ncbi:MULTISPECIES: hypothetical protein [Pseudomonas]|nr:MULTISPECIES: hypothetical protein [Pseudomonas]
MSWLDKVASYILSIHWSRGEGAAGGHAKLATKATMPTGKEARIRNRQLESHLDCVAVALVDSKWYIAANRLNLYDTDIILTDHSLGRPIDATEFFGGVSYFGYISNNYEIIREGGDHMHAEMKILKYLQQIGKLDVRIHIGVSKPCCPLCKKTLDDWQVEYTSYHDVMPSGDTWIDPQVGHPSDDINIIRDLFR